jgi:hypothetical protein
MAGVGAERMMELGESRWRGWTPPPSHQQRLTTPPLPPFLQTRPAKGMGRCRRGTSA